MDERATTRGFAANKNGIPHRNSHLRNKSIKDDQYLNNQFRSDYIQEYIIQRVENWETAAYRCCSGKGK